MATKLTLKTTFEADRVIQPVFTGGSVALDNGAKILATTLGEDAVLTNLTTGKHIAKIEGDGEPISTLTLTPSASHLIVCSRSLSMRIYSLKAMDDNAIETTLVRTLKPHATPVVVLAVDKTSTLLATGAADGAIKIWDILGGYVTHTVSGPSVLISALHFFEIAAGGLEVSHKTKKSSRKGQEENGEATSSFRLAYGRQDGKIRVWDLHKRGNVNIPDNADSPHHVTNVQGLDYSPTQNTLVSTSRDRTIIWWNVRTWKRRMISVREPMEAVGFLGDGRLTFAAGANGFVRIWETDTGRELTTEQPAKAEGEAIVSAIYNGSDSLVLCAQADHTIAIYQAPTVAASAPLPHELGSLQPSRRISGTHDDILDLTYILPDRSLLALATNSEDVRLVSIRDSEPDYEGSTGARSGYFGQDVALLKGHSEIVMCLDVDWSGHWIATGSRDNTARVWRVDHANGSYTCHAVFTGHVGPLGAVALPKKAPQGSSEAFKDTLSHPPAFLLTGSGDLNVKKWPIPRLEQSDSEKGPRAVFSRKAHDKDINALDVSSNGQLFASASQDKSVKIWDVEAGEVQGILRGHKRGVWSVKLAPSNLPALQGDNGAVSGKGVALTGSGDKTIKLWNLSDYTCIRTFEGHSNNVLKVAWLSMPEESNNAKQRALFASAGGDGLVKVWDANLGETECTLDNHEDRVWALTVHPTTNTIVSGGGDSIINFWKDTSEQTQAAATDAALKLVEQEQELENYIYAGSYREAIILALQLNHPGRLLNLFTNVVTTSNPDKGSLTGLKAVDKVLANLSDEQIFLMLLRLRDWNTNAKTAPIAQRILWALVRSYPASKFSKLSVKGARGQKSLKEVLNALKVYTERHYKRMEELVDESYLVEYTLQEMDNLAPALEHERSAAGSSIGGDAIMADA